MSKKIDNNTPIKIWLPILDLDISATGMGDQGLHVLIDKIL